MNNDISHRLKASPIFVAEILTQILSYTIYHPEPPGRFRLLSPRLPSRADAPWPFLLVCKYWHDITLTTPSLWSTFVAVLEKDPTHEEVAHLPSMLRTHLRLSKNETLTLIISWTSSSKGYSPDDVSNTDPVIPLSRMIYMAEEKQHQWGDVVVSLRTLSNSKIIEPTPIDFAFKLAEMKALQHLSVNGHAHSGTRRLELTNSPTLKTLSVGGSTDLIITHREDGPLADYFPNLTTIHLSPSPRTFRGSLSLLGLASNVEWFDITFGLRGLPIQDSEHVAIELPKLRNLTIRSSKHQPNVWLLRRLSIPSLERLELESIVRRGDLRRYAAVLQTLPMATLCLELETYERDPGLAIFLQSLGPLHHLQVNGQRCRGSEISGFVQDLVMALNARSTSNIEPLLPRLQSLDIQARVMDPVMRGFIFDCSTLRVLKQVILQCRKSYGGAFHISISYKTRFSDSIEIQDILPTDPEILRCVTKDFVVKIHGVYLTATCTS